MAKRIVIETLQVHHPETDVIGHQRATLGRRAPAANPVDDTESVPLGVTDGNPSTRIGGILQCSVRVHDVSLVQTKRTIPVRQVWAVCSTFGDTRQLFDENGNAIVIAIAENHVHGCQHDFVGVRWCGRPSSPPQHG
jgi:hypothetical protein